MDIHLRFFNEAIELMPFKDGKVLNLGSDFEGNSAGALEDEMNKFYFVLNASKPGEYLRVYTGGYLTDPNTGAEYYDNYNNRHLIVEKNHFKTYLPKILKKEIELYRRFNNDPKRGNIMNIAKEFNLEHLID